MTTAPKEAYRSIPAGLIEPCVVKDIEMKTVADIVMSRGLWKSGFEKCSAKVGAIRKHDADARKYVNSN